MKSKINYHSIKPIKGIEGYEFSPEISKLWDMMIADTNDNDDALIVVVGPEGAGKSILAQQIYGYFADRIKTCNLSVDNIHFDGQSYIETSLNGKKAQVNILDESRRALNKMRTMSSKNQQFNDFLSECRSQNQIHIVLLPAYSDLDRYVAVHRPKIIIKVHKFRNPKTGRIIRGHFSVYGTSDKNLLNYAWDNKYKPFPLQMLYCKGYFKNQSPIDKEEYENKKEEAKKKRYIEGEDEDNTNNYNKMKSSLIIVLGEMRKMGMKETDAAKLLKDYISVSTVQQLWKVSKD